MDKALRLLCRVLSFQFNFRSKGRPSTLADCERLISLPKIIGALNPTMFLLLAKSTSLVLLVSTDCSCLLHQFSIIRNADKFTESADK